MPFKCVYGHEPTISLAEEGAAPKNGNPLRPMKTLKYEWRLCVVQGTNKWEVKGETMHKIEFNHDEKLMIINFSISIRSKDYKVKIS